MTVNTEILLSNVVHGDPSGTYDGSSLDWSSEPVKAAAYYRGRGGIQTVLFNINAVEGLIHIEATLDDDPDSADWFDVDVFGNLNSPVTTYYTSTITGNFTWLRARVQGFTTGTINTVSVTY